MTVWVRQPLPFTRHRSWKLLALLFLSIATLAALFSFSPTAEAAPSTSKTISFSARLRSSGGEVAPDGYYNVSFRLYTASQAGSPIWSETYFDENGGAEGEDYRVKVVNGYLNVKLGSRTAFGSNINWNDDLWLTMNIGGTSQTANVGAIPWDGEMSPRIQLTAVPYALSAGSLEGLGAGDFVQLGQGVQTNSSDNPSIHINTTGSGNLVQLQRNADDVFTITSEGNISFGSSSDHTIAIEQSDSGEDGRTLTISGGDGGSGTTNGGNLVLSGGSGSEGGADGLVVLTTATFATATNDANCYAGGALVGSSCVVSQSTVDTSSAVIIGFSAADQTATLPDPTLMTPGRILYVMAANDSSPFTLIVNEDESIAMKSKSAQTLLWNGSDWVSANASSPPPPAPQPEVNLEEGSQPAPDITIEEGAENPALEIEESNLPEGAPTDTPAETGEDEAFRLDNLEEAPAALPGTMYYDTNLGKVQCYESTGWGACGDAPDTFVTISPEYVNAVMNGTDIGIISSNFCSGTLGINDGSDTQPTVCGPNETYNFYSWTSEEEEDQTRSIYLTYQLPDNFKSFVADSTSIMGRTDSENSKVDYRIYRDNGSGLLECGEDITVSEGWQDSWQKGSATEDSDPSECDFEAGDSILFRINLTAKKATNAYVSNVNFIFRNN